MADETAALHLGDTFISETGSYWATESRMKRLFDIGFAATMIVLFAPVMLTISFLIVLVDRGPLIFAHQRVGKGNRTFRCLKFRTMVTNADQRLDDLLLANPELRTEWARSRKLKNDPRIIAGIGQILRKTSLDELPQFFNVLMGDMSIVGPRPVVQDELAYYGDAQDEYLSVRPGLTGPWQSASRSDVSYEMRVRQDVNYVRHGTLKTDIKIVGATAWKFLRFNLRGAY